MPSILRATVAASALAASTLALPSTATSVNAGPLPISAGAHTLTVGAVVLLAPVGTTPGPTRYDGKLTITALPIPEPETWLLMTVGLLAVMVRRKA